MALFQTASRLRREECVGTGVCAPEEAGRGTGDPSSTALSRRRSGSSRCCSRCSQQRLAAHCSRLLRYRRLRSRSTRNSWTRAHTRRNLHPSSSLWRVEAKRTAADVKATAAAAKGMPERVRATGGVGRS
eukprot:380259-Prymnesium_polylepis.2